MVKSVIIAKKIQTIEDSIEFLKKYELIDMEKFKTDLLIQSACHFHIEKMIQSLMDLIMHIISEKGWGIYLHSSNIAELLFKKNVIHAEHQKLLINIHGYRNRLIHEYEDIDLSISYDILTNKKEDVRNILNKILEYLGY